MEYRMLYVSLITMTSIMIVKCQVCSPKDYLTKAIVNGECKSDDKKYNIDASYITEIRADAFNDVPEYSVIQISNVNLDNLSLTFKQLIYRLAFANCKFIPKIISTVSINKLLFHNSNNVLFDSRDNINVDSVNNMEIDRQRFPTLLIMGMKMTCGEWSNIQNPSEIRNIILDNAVLPPSLCLLPFTNLSHLIYKNISSKFIVLSTNPTVFRLDTNPIKITVYDKYNKISISTISSDHNKFPSVPQISCGSEYSVKLHKFTNNFSRNLLTSEVTDDDVTLVCVKICGNTN
ncbi:hypothetical protein GJ496_004235 [Pomphorhynchus laevis]|nr:hypothetical protein GJ496_004235 [Pomphorhynchus laevis]